MPQITANIKSEELVRKARIRAIESGKSLREWSGEVLTVAISAATSRKKGAK